MKATTHSRIAVWMVGALALFLLLYSAIRSSTLCLTIDEAFTFQRYVKNSNFFPREYDMHTANFHMLNTWLMIISSKLFGIAEWALRLPNVIAHAFYLFFTARFALKSKTAWSGVAVFILLNVHPYLLDFFSVARGYGLMFGFLAGTLWYVCEFFTAGKQLKHLALALFFAGLAMWSNFSGLTVFLAVALLIFIGVLFTKDATAKYKLRGVLIIGLLFIPFVAVAYSVIVQLQEANAFFFVYEGFWNETVCVLGAKLIYPLTGDIYTTHSASTGVVLLILLLPAAIITYAIIRGSRPFFGSHVVILLSLFTAVLLLIVVQHFVFQAPYPSGRTALFVFVIFLWILAAAIRDTTFPGRVGQVVCSIVAGGLLLLAGMTCNFSRTSEWNYCADVRTGLQDILVKSETGSDSLNGIVLGHDTEFGNILAYYRLRDQIGNVTLSGCSETEDPLADYYMLSPYVKHNVGACDTIINYQPSELLVLRNRISKWVNTEPVQERDRTAKVRLTDVSQRAELLKDTLNAVDGCWARVDFQMCLQFPEEHAQCIIQFWHERNDSLIWSGYSFVEAFGNIQPSMRSISQIYPRKVARGDVISVTLIPEESVDGPIEISQIRALLRVSE